MMYIYGIKCKHLYQCYPMPIHELLYVSHMTSVSVHIKSNTTNSPNNFDYSGNEQQHIPPFNIFPYWPDHRCLLEHSKHK